MLGYFLIVVAILAPQTYASCSCDTSIVGCDTSLIEEIYKYLDIADIEYTFQDKLYGTDWLVYSSYNYHPYYESSEIVCRKYYYGEDYLEYTSHTTCGEINTYTLDLTEVGENYNLYGCSLREYFWCFNSAVAVKYTCYYDSTEYDPGYSVEILANPYTVNYPCSQSLIALIVEILVLLKFDTFWYYDYEYCRQYYFPTPNYIQYQEFEIVEYETVLAENLFIYGDEGYYEEGNEGCEVYSEEDEEEEEEDEEEDEGVEEPACDEEEEEEGEESDCTEEEEESDCTEEEEETECY